MDAAEHVVQCQASIRFARFERVQSNRPIGLAPAARKRMDAQLSRKSWAEVGIEANWVCFGGRRSTWLPFGQSRVMRKICSNVAKLRPTQEKKRAPRDRRYRAAFTGARSRLLFWASTRSRKQTAPLESAIMQLVQHRQPFACAHVDMCVVGSRAFGDTSVAFTANHWRPKE